MITCHISVGGQQPQNVGLLGAANGPEVVMDCRLSNERLAAKQPEAPGLLVDRGNSPAKASRDLSGPLMGVAAAHFIQLRCGPLSYLLSLLQAETASANPKGTLRPAQAVAKFLRRHNAVVVPEKLIFRGCPPSPPNPFHG